LGSRYYTWYRYDCIVCVVCILLFLFYPKEVDDLIIGSSELRFPDGGLYFTRYSNILIYIQQDGTLHSLFYLETAVHVSGGTSTHHQERKTTIYTIWYLSHRIVNCRYRRIVGTGLSVLWVAYAHTHTHTHTHTHIHTHTHTHTHANHQTDNNQLYISDQRISL
jgi:hypothetical protein